MAISSFLCGCLGFELESSLLHSEHCTHCDISPAQQYKLNCEYKMISLSCEKQGLAKHEYVGWSGRVGSGQQRSRHVSSWEYGYRSQPRSVTREDGSWQRGFGIGLAIAQGLFFH